MIAASEQELIDAGATRRQAQSIRAELSGAKNVGLEAENAEDAAIDNAFQPD